MNECVIYDFETLSQDQNKGVVISLALLSYTESRFASNPYTYEELLSNCKKLKFNVEDQVNTHGRTISKETLGWWKNQNKEAQKQLVPLDTDVFIDALHGFLIDNIDLKNHKKAFTRGNTFDPIFLDSLLKDCGKTNPMHWGSIRDTRSYIEGMSFGSKLNNNYMPEGLQEKFIAHDPCHDISLDVMRMQTLAQMIVG
jgi:hypothetical protein